MQVNKKHKKRRQDSLRFVFERKSLVKPKICIKSISFKHGVKLYEKGRRKGRGPLRRKRGGRREAGRARKSPLSVLNEFILRMRRKGRLCR